MGYFKKIVLNNYRNFQNYENNFSNSCNVLYGKNGSGKTNILESLSLFYTNSSLVLDKTSILTFDLVASYSNNLEALCCNCHGKKTMIENMK